MTFCGHQLQLIILSYYLYLILFLNILKIHIIILFNNEINKEISIINYDNIKDLNKLHSIIKNNRKQKDILVKTNYDELRENNLRIGFNLYQLEKDNEIRDINKIVDENYNVPLAEGDNCEATVYIRKRIVYGRNCKRACFV